MARRLTDGVDQILQDIAVGLQWAVWTLQGRRNCLSTRGQSSSALATHENEQGLEQSMHSQRTGEQRPE